nr:hypothetical protein [Pararhizobium antarcticum]
MDMTRSRQQRSSDTRISGAVKRTRAKRRGAKIDRWQSAFGSRADGDLVLFFPITTKQPEANRFAVEIPAIEKRRAGLDVDLRLWIILDEFNSDVIGRSFYLEPEPPIGRFSKAFFLPLLREFIGRRKSFAEVSRSR